MAKDPFIHLMELKAQGARERFQASEELLKEALDLLQGENKGGLMAAGQMVAQSREIAAEGVRLLDEILTLGEPLPKRKRQR